MKKSIKLICVLFILFYILSKYDSVLGFWSGYTYSQDSTFYKKILKDEQVVVDSTIIDIDRIGDLVLGIKIPSISLRCIYDSKIHNHTFVQDIKVYFLLNMSSGELFEYKEQESFEEKLSKLGVVSLSSLDYSKFEYFRNAYSSKFRFNEVGQQDLSKCVNSIEAKLRPKTYINEKGFTEIEIYKLK